MKNYQIRIYWTRKVNIVGLFGKIKDILFEEEEVEEEEELVVRPPKKEEPKVREEVKEVPKKETSAPAVKVEEKPKVEEPKEEFLGERDIYNKETRSTFWDFDEEEFSSLLTTPRNRGTNVLEYERKKKTEKRMDYGRYERTEVKETVERKKFKPSPIISPVYGILNEDYRIEDIKTKEEDLDSLDIDKVRKKAFEPEIKKEEPKVDYYEEETVTVKYEEPEEEKIQKGKTIDDLLEETSDDVIDLSHNKEKSIEYDEDEDEEIKLEDEEPEDMAKEIPEVTIEDTSEDNKEDDTMESDLFDLIDSMYENREDGE